MYNWELHDWKQFTYEEEELKGLVEDYNHTKTRYLGSESHYQRKRKSILYSKR